MDSLGIILLMLTRAWTAQSRYDIPLKINLNFVCSKIKPDPEATCLLLETKIIMQDGAKMTYMHCFKAHDTCLGNCMHQLDTTFEGLIILFVDLDKYRSDCGRA